MKQNAPTNSLFARQELPFVHDGLKGTMDKWGFVRLGNAGFWVCNARPALIRTIHRALIRHPEFIRPGPMPLF